MKNSVHEAPILFLDFDGVINDNEEQVTEEAIEVLYRLYSSSKAKIVVISNWLEDGCLAIQKRLRQFLSEFGFSEEAIDFIDPNFIGEEDYSILPPRILGIIHYMNEHIGREYVILDDQYQKMYQMLHLHHYQTRQAQGLRYLDEEKITFQPYSVPISIPYRHRPLTERENLTNRLIKVLKKDFS